MYRTSLFIGVGFLFASAALQGCFFVPSPGGLQGAWGNVSEDNDATDGITSRTTTTFRFAGDSITRRIEMSLRDVESGDRVLLVGEDTGTYAVDDSIEPARMDVIGIERTVYPSQVDLGGAAGLLGLTTDQVKAYLDESLAISLQPKGIYAREDSILRLRFGTATEYPPDLESGPVIAVELNGRFWFFQVW